MSNTTYYHKSVHTAPSIQPPMAVPTPHLWPPTSRSTGRDALLAAKANVVANGCVGFGAPETVTVAALGFVAVDPLVDAPEARMEKRGDVPYMAPCVELMNSRK